MTASTLTLTYGNPAGSVIDDPLWLRLQQDGVAADVATVADAAAVLDALYDIEPCVEAEETESLSVIDNPLTTADLTAAAAVIDYSICDQEPDGSVNVTVRIIRSDLSWPYMLRISGGRVVAAIPGEAETPVEVRELYQQNIVVESASSIVLGYPVISGFSASWLGAVIGETGRVDAPTINRTGSTLHWSGNVTGIIAVSFNTVYEVATIRVEGVDGHQGECLIRCFYHGLVEELEPILPESAEMDRSVCPRSIWQGDGREDEVTCYQEVTIKTLCECSREEISSRIENQVQPCPDWAPTRCPNNDRECMHLLGSATAYEYVACAGDNEMPGMPGRVYALSSKEFYEDTCCEKPKVSLPQCPEKKISYRGGEPITLGAPYYRQTYGPLTRIVPVSPPGGICGEHIIRQVIGDTNCCEGVPPLVWDTSISPDVMSPNSFITIGITGGRAPYVWTLSGHGVQFQNGAKRITTTANRIYLAALPIACGWVGITVTDGCTTVNAGLRITVGEWLLVGFYFTNNESHPYNTINMLRPYCGTVLVSGLYLPAAFDGSVSEISADNRYWMGGGSDISHTDPILPGQVGRPMRYVGQYATKGVPLGSGCLDGYAPLDPYVGLFNPILGIGCSEYEGGVYSRTPAAEIKIYQWGCSV